MKNKFILAIFTLCLVLFYSCEYQPTGSNFKNIDSTYKIPSIIIELPEDGKTIEVNNYERYDIKYKLSGDLSKFKYDDVISNYEYGILLKTKSADENRIFRIQFYGEFGATSIVFKSTELHRIGTEPTKISDKITNTINFIELGLRPNFYYKGFNFSAGASYYFELPPDVYFLIEKPIDLNIGFSGVRPHLGVGYKF